LANALRRLGVKKGDRIGTLFYNSPEELITYMAIFQLGAILVPLNFRLASQEIVLILENSDASLLVSGEEFVGLIGQIRKDISKVKRIIVSGQRKPEGEFLRWEELVAAEQNKPPWETLSDDDSLYILYTSGTTGRPKGVVITNKNLIWNSLNGVISGVLSGDEVVYYGLPLFHGAAMGGYFATALLGGTVVLEKSFDAAKALSLVEKEKITVIPAVPPMLIAFLDLPGRDTYDISSLKYFSTGATIVPQAVKEKLKRCFPNVGIADSYGLTEATGYVTILPDKDFLRKKACVGLPHAFVEIRIIDEQNRDVKTGEVGEILVRGPNVMKEYYKNPQATAETIIDGWLHTGDMGKKDEEGYLYVVDRMKDMIISGGENIYPREIEELLYTHPKIEDVAVIGVPDEKWGEVAKVVIVLKSGQVLSEQEVLDFCREHLAHYKCPHHVEFVDALPHTSTGKVLKRDIRKSYGGITIKKY
jgi:acyl-CoA synthetase (AMP-forming)/AMP-acid ligase II